ncbi:MAG: response regulator, partial [Paramuribaculum sp.]|nr:response regulator [Paramuribaculum sp.]
MPQQHTILWADDEIDLLKPHIMFLRAKGYDVVTVNNGADALDLVSQRHFNLIILDENMPGITGLETLARINVIAPNIPVIMITKSEEENIMDQAVGNKIADYLIKPVNPNQILLSIKKNLHSGQLVSEHTAGGYRQDFNNISTLINNARTLTDWQNLYRTLTHWEIELSDSDTGMVELLDMQKIEANAAFGKFVRKNYESWISSDSPARPTLSPDVFKRKVFPELDNGHKIFFILIDNFRFDQWRTLRPILSDFFTINEDLYTSILPTATQYARNSIFSGLMPADIAAMFPDLWVDEDEAEGKNLNESPLI